MRHYPAVYGPTPVNGTYSCSHEPKAPNLEAVTNGASGPCGNRLKKLRLREMGNGFKIAVARVILNQYPTGVPYTDTEVLNRLPEIFRYSRRGTEYDKRHVALARRQLAIPSWDSR